MKLKPYAVIAFATVALTVVPALAQVEISRDGRPERIFHMVQGMNNQDFHFLKTAAAINMFEIQSSELALQKSSDPFVTEYAKEMITDHQMSLVELKGIAANKGIELPQVLPNDLLHALMHLENQTGSTFDAAYQNVQRNGHADASEVFVNEIEGGKDEDVKAFSVKTLPTVDMHYRMMLNKETMMGATKMSHGD